MTDGLTEEQDAELRTGVDRLLNHPAWTAPFDSSDGMAALKVALEKNQEVPKVLEGLGLDLSYLLLGDKSTGYKNVWGAHP